MVDRQRRRTDETYGPTELDRAKGGLKKFVVETMKQPSSPAARALEDVTRMMDDSNLGAKFIEEAQARRRADEAYDAAYAETTRLALAVITERMVRNDTLGFAVQLTVGDIFHAMYPDPDIGEPFPSITGDQLQMRRTGINYVSVIGPNDFHQSHQLSDVDHWGEGDRETGIQVLRSAYEQGHVLMKSHR